MEHHDVDARVREQLGRRLDIPGHAHALADAYVLSCTTVRTAETIETLERSLGRPVVTSNTAVAWYCMRKLGALPGVPGYGRLLARAGAP